MIHSHEFDTATATDHSDLAAEDLAATGLPMRGRPVAAKSISLANLVTIGAAASFCWGVVAICIIALR
ncbi:hypothetical protein [Sphingomonas yabuuchiae]|uniref:hypothetical protein n=1 Tax=Sphingomonas yabuuchiae TaxID=172044 RepID=UPI001F993DEF|nr:hypothetical protein [uncultured Sphingomonas sp.]HIV77218.1 hypothetical protein [Candidatus Sphingomonas excrementigallinarum]